MTVIRAQIIFFNYLVEFEIILNQFLTTGFHFLSCDSLNTLRRESGREGIRLVWLAKSNLNPSENVFLGCLSRIEIIYE